MTEAIRARGLRGGLQVATNPAVREALGQKPRELLSQVLGGRGETSAPWWPPMPR